jgi:hypothetical protein
MVMDGRESRGSRAGPRRDRASRGGASVLRIGILDTDADASRDEDLPKESRPIGAVMVGRDGRDGGRWGRIAAREHDGALLYVADKIQGWSNMGVKNSCRALVVWRVKSEKGGRRSAPQSRMTADGTLLQVCIQGPEYARLCRIE